MTTTLVLGGVRSGKSRHAEALMGQGPVTYIAPGRPANDSDPEWAARVREHQAGRPASWTTLETRDLASAIGGATQAVLVDCLGVWLARVLDECDGWTDPEVGAQVLARAGEELLAAWRAAPTEVVLVSNEVGLGVVPATPSGRLFRDELGRLNAALSAAADRVHLVVAGRVLDLSAAPVVGE